MPTSSRETSANAIARSSRTLRSRPSKKPRVRSPTSDSFNSRESTAVSRTPAATTASPEPEYVRTSRSATLRSGTRHRKNIGGTAPKARLPKPAIISLDAGTDDEMAIELPANETDGLQVT